jgi:xanthine dehydrogenase accessory factor
MQSSQLDVLQGCLACLQQGRKITLVSVAKTWGTSPRPIGALLAVCDDGRFYGSVSGGCVEEDLIDRLKDNPVTHVTQFVYGETSTQREQFGLPCGGSLELVLEPFNDVAHVQQIINAINDRTTLYRRVALKDSGVSLDAIQPNDDAQLTPTHWGNIFGPVWQMLIVGAGETGQFLAQMAPALGYRVLVSDPRPQYIKNWPLKNIPLLPGFPDDIIEKMQIDHRTVIVTVAHDPKVDDMALLQALHSDAFYVGALGSVSNNKARRARLVEHFGFNLAQVNRLHGPVGLPIGSKTPPEIALAILAEVTALRNGRDIKAQLSVAKMSQLQSA